VIGNRKIIELRIGGKDRTLVFGMNTIADLEEKFGVHPLAIVRDLGEAINRDVLSGKIVSTLRTCLWAAMRQRSPGLKIEAVGDDMQVTEFKDYLEACIRGISAAMGHDIDKAQAKAEALAEARRKSEAGEPMTADEQQAVGEAASADPLAPSIPQNATPQSSTDSASKPSRPG
jgi:hypothetical protein